MMFIVMKMHGGLVDVRLKCIVGIGQGCYFMGHENVPPRGKVPIMSSLLCCKTL
jgi:hypothetical protein